MEREIVSRSVLGLPCVLDEKEILKEYSPKMAHKMEESLKGLNSNDRSNSNEGSVRETSTDLTCVTYRPHLWKKNFCRDCGKTKEEHPSSILEAQVNKDDPTEVFEILDVLGTGAYGSVCLAVDVKSRNTYAIKFIEIGAKKAKEVMGIVNEIQIMKESIECPYIVEFHGCYMKDDVIMIVMEYCACSVEDVLFYCAEEELQETHIAAVCAAIIKSLAYLHSFNVSHRDIKSANILLKESGEVKIADFGVAHKLKSERDKLKTMAGSPYWFAPEVISADSYDNKVDIWATGIVAIEMAESRPPHYDMEPLQVLFVIPKQPPPRLKDPKKWSPDFLDFLEKCLQMDPAHRAPAKELLRHPFILKGSSAQILEPFVKKCLPVLIPRREEDLKEELDEDVVQKGTILAVDKTTYQAEVIGVSGSKRSGSVAKKNSLKSADSEDIVSIIDQLINYLTAEALEVEGIFRVGASIRTINDIKSSFQKGDEIDWSRFDAHSIAGVLKTYLRELPEPLLLPIYQKYKEQVDSKKITDASQYLTLIKSLVNSLSPDNKKILDKLIGFLSLVASNSKTNNMPASNLAKCLSSELVFKRDESPEVIIKNSTYVNHLLQTLIEHHKKIFM